MIYLKITIICFIMTFAAIAISEFVNPSTDKKYSKLAKIFGYIIAYIILGALFSSIASLIYLIVHGG